MSETPSDTFWDDWLAKSAHSSQQGQDGRTQVMCLDPRGASRGAFSTPNTQVWRSDASASSLSDVVEEGPIPETYYLSATALQGIARRCEKAGMSIPTALARALFTSTVTPDRK